MEKGNNSGITGQGTAVGFSEKEKVNRETMGKFFYDLGKASFTTMVIGAMMSFFSDPVVIWKTICLLGVGLFLTFFLAFVGSKILKH